MEQKVYCLTVGITRVGPGAKRRVRQAAKCLRFPEGFVVYEESGWRWPFAYRLIYDCLVYGNDSATKFVEQARIVGMSGLVRANKPAPS